MAFAISFVAVGLPYWQIPYAQISLPNAVWSIGLLVVVALSAVSCVLSATRFWFATLVVGISVPAAVLARVMVETSTDPTSHNLWPFEIVLSAGPGFLASGVGALIGGLWARRDDV